MLTLTARFSGVVGSFNNDDYYEFTLTSTQTVTLDLATIYGAPYLYLLNSAGSQIEYSYADTGNAADAAIVETLAPGTYYAEVYNTSTTPYTLSMYYGSPTVGDGSSNAGGQTLATARSFGQLSTTPTTVAGYVGGGDPGDYFSFTVGSTSTVNLQLTGLENYAYLYLLNASGSELDEYYTSSNGMVDATVILPTLAAGTYYLEVTPTYTNYPTGYNLSVDATALPEVAGGSVATALSMGTLGTTAETYTGEVNGTNSANYYSFSVAANSAVSVLLSGVTANASIELFNAAGNEVSYTATASASPTSNGSFVYDLAPLVAGTYYIGVFNDYDATDYTLAASAKPLTLAGSSIATATAISLAATAASVTDDVENIYPNDYYKFTLTSAATIDFRLVAGGGDVFADAGMTLYNSSGTALTNTETTTTSDGLITENLGAGTYYLSVNQYDGWQTPFTLTYWTGAPAVGTPTGSHAGSTLGTAENIGALTSTPISIADWVGTAHIDDYYEFTLTTTSNVRIDVTGQTSNVTVDLLNLSGAYLAGGSGGAITDDSVVDQLAAGTYFIDVNYDNSSSTGFNLGIATTALPNTGGISLASADNIGTLGTATQTVTGYVGPVDESDYIEFHLSSASTVNAALSGLSNSNIDLELLNVSGGEIASSYGEYGGNASVIEDLAAGTYFLEVYGGGNSSDYTMSVNATPIVDSAGTTLSTATNIDNTIGLSGSAGQYDIVNDSGTLYVQDTVANRDGTQTLPGISDMVFTNGVGLFDPTGTAEEVARLYGAALNRAPDLAGLESWVTEINDDGVSLTTAATDFTASTEFQQDYGALSNTAFVTLLSNNVLDRAPDQAGLQAWVADLSGGMSRGQVLLGFAESEEYIVDQISFAGDPNYGEAYRLYQAALDRTPDAAGLAYWVDDLANGMTPIAAAQGFISSTEFQTDYGSLSIDDFVTTMYNNVLHRAPDPSGYQYWVGQMEGGASEATVLLGFSDSVENRLNTASATHDGWVFIS